MDKNMDFVCELTGEKIKASQAQAVKVYDKIVVVNKDFAELFQKSASIVEDAIRQVYYKKLEDVDKNEKSNLNKNKFSDISIIKPKDLFIKLSDYIIGQEMAKKVISVALHKHYSYIAKKQKDSSYQKSNIIFVGDSGVGKSYIASTISKIIQVPFAIGDCTSITEAGYVGDDVDTIISYLLAEAKNDAPLAESGICFLDEFDKITKKTGDNPSITRDVSGEGVQQALLKIVEGSDVYVQPIQSGKRKHPMIDTIKINTSNVLFIAAGVFPKIENIISKRINLQPSIGFRNQSNYNEKTIKQERDELLNSISSDDLISYGFIPEIIGRFSIIVPFRSLTKDDMINILMNTKNSLYKQYQKMFELAEINISIDERAIDLICDKAITSSTGARSLKNILDNFLMELYYDNVGDYKGDLAIPCEYIEERLGK